MTTLDFGDDEPIDWVAIAEDLICPKGEPWTGNDNRTDHGHTVCAVIGGLLNEIDNLKVEIGAWALTRDNRDAEIRRLENELARTQR